MKNQRDIFPRITAESASQQEHRNLLERVILKDFIDDYQGVRISKSGRRFLIVQATVWNLIDEAGKIMGQAAMFKNWDYLLG